ncbi:MAG: hypothetical protein HY606_06035 [Planctomycetes bacterium]|nr:hypothetical protein [Planctomycetota bacterium]
MRKFESGNTIAIGMIFTTVVAAASFALLTVTSSSQRETIFEEYRIQALYKAQGAISQALLELNNNIDYDEQGIGTVNKTFADGQYYTTFTRDANGQPKLTATGISNVGGEREIKRIVEAVLSDGAGVNVPGFGNQLAAFGIYGDLRKVKMKFGRLFFERELRHIRDEGEFDRALDRIMRDFGNDEDFGGFLRELIDEHDMTVSGMDISGDGKNVPGLGIEDTDIYQSVMEQISRAARRGRIDPAMFSGVPVVEYTDRRGDILRTSSVNIKDPILSADFYDLIVDKITYIITEDLLPKTDTVITGNRVRINSELDLGGDANSVVYVNVDRLELNSTLQGKGTLIIQGDVDVRSNGNFKWEGNVIVLPEIKRRDRRNLINLIKPRINVVQGDRRNNDEPIISHATPRELGNLGTLNKRLKFHNKGGDVAIQGSLIMLSNSNSHVSFITDRAVHGHDEQDRRQREEEERVRMNEREREQADRRDRIQRENRERRDREDNDFRSNRESEDREINNRRRDEDRDHNCQGHGENRCRGNGERRCEASRDIIERRQREDNERRQRRDDDDNNRRVQREREDREVEVQIAGPGIDFPHTYIKGAAVLMSHSRSGKANFKLKDGIVDIEGTLSMIGNKTNLNIAPRRHHPHNLRHLLDRRHAHDRLHPSFNVDGAVVLAAPTNDRQNHKSKVVLQGDVEVNFHSVNVREATRALLQFARLLGPDTPLESKYTVLSWREVTDNASGSNAGN